MKCEIHNNELKYIGRTIVTFKWENTMGEHYEGEGPAIFVAEVWRSHPDVRRIYDIRIKQTKQSEAERRYYRAEPIKARAGREARDYMLLHDDMF